MLKIENGIYTIKNDFLNEKGILENVYTSYFVIKKYMIMKDRHFLYDTVKKMYPKSSINDDMKKEIDIVINCYFNIIKLKILNKYNHHINDFIIEKILQKNRDIIYGCINICPNIRNIIYTYTESYFYGNDFCKGIF